MIVAAQLHHVAGPGTGRYHHPAAASRGCGLDGGIDSWMGGIWGHDSVRGDDQDSRLIRQAVRASPAADWSIAALSDLCACRPDTLRQRFHRRHGYGPGELVKRERMALADAATGYSRP
jgi:AraC-like DNA-binding protein